MVRILIFNLLMFGICGYALWKGTRDAKIVAATCIISSFASMPLGSDYESVAIRLIIVDLIVLAIFVHVAIQSDRFWPMWIAGLHVTTIFGHFLKLMSGEMVPIAYAVALRFWAYPELLILAIAVWRSEQRRRRQGGTLAAPS